MFQRSWCLQSQAGRNIVTVLLINLLLPLFGLVAGPGTAAAETDASAAGTIRLNAGGPAYVDKLGRSWSADTGATAGLPHASTLPIHGTSDSTLYQTCRQAADFTYSFAVPSGTYKVRVMFAEPWFRGANNRKFDVFINGLQVLSLFDVVAAAGGRFVAVDQEFTATAMEGALRIGFVGRVGSPVLSAIEVTPQTAVAVSPASATLSGGRKQQFTTAGVQVYWSVQPAIGVIDASGLYTAPASIVAKQVVMVTATNKTNIADSARVLVTLAPSGPLRVNVGGAAYIDPAGQAWTGSNGFIGGGPSQSTSTIAATDGVRIYQTAQQGEAFGYQTVVPNGSYTVNLKFADIYYNSVGQRIFDVMINGRTVLGSFDIVAQAGGGLKAVDRSFPVEVANGQLTVQLYPSISSPMLNGLEILPAEAADATAPVVAITSPANNQTVSGSVVIVASASDNVEVSGVQFKIDGIKAGASIAAPPYSLTFDTRTVANGAHSLTATAVDAEGNAASSAPVVINVRNISTDTQPPTVSVSTPATGQAVSGTITLTASATDNLAVASVQFKADGANAGAILTAAPYSVSLDTRTLTTGPHSITAMAVDAAGNTSASAAVIISVNNGTQPPAVPSGLHAAALSERQIDLSWTAATGNPAVTGYRIYRGGVQIATSGAAFYSDKGLTASTTYTYTVAAYDAAGNVSAQSAAVTAVTNAAPSSGETVSRYEVYERTFAFASAGYSNPWEQVTAALTLTSPSGATVTVGGFYYGPDTWKARYAPAVTGNWTWRATVGDGTRSQHFSGAFTVIDSTRPGYVRQSSGNKLRWMFDNGTPYYPLGIGDCINTGLNDMSMDSRTVTKEEYFSTFRRAGVNLFRWSVDNCSYKLWNTIAITGNSYLVAEGQAGDNLARTLRQNDMRTYMTIFGFAVPFNTNPSTAQLDAVKRYVKYVVDRYGAYVDFWELMNEATADPMWYDQVTRYLRSIDPYHHPISTSWERPFEPGIDIVSPHWFQTELANEIDLYPAWKIRDWKAAGKPVIVGEQGNATCNWDASSAVRMRVRAWTSFFNEAALVFWHTGYRQSYCHNPANIYLGPEERGYLKVLQDFTQGIPAGSGMTGTMSGSSGTLPVSDLSKVRAYGLASPTVYAAYVHAYANHTTATSGIRITVAPQATGVATWYSPATGQVLGTQNISAGSQSLTVPAFTTDVALIIR